MTRKAESPYDALERVFHEPSRLAILSSLIGAGGKATFSELKEACDLTDGNLSRHLKTLEGATIVRIQKSFRASRPRTTVVLSKRGRARFLEYLTALESVLEDASRRMTALEREAGSPRGRSARMRAVRARPAEA
jgi:DNA-binding transcriptional ArsR family regulator